MHTRREMQRGRCKEEIYRHAPDTAVRITILMIHQINQVTNGRDVRVTDVLVQRACPEHVIDVAANVRHNRQRHKNHPETAEHFGGQRARCSVVAYHKIIQHHVTTPYNHTI